MARVEGIIEAGQAAFRDFTAENSSADVLENRIRERAGRRTRADTAGLPPDWLTTAGAGFGVGAIFGPVGALVGAGVAGILSKRRRTALAEYANQDAEATETTLAKGFATLDLLAERHADNPEMLAEIELYREEAEKFAALTGSPDSGVRASALTSFGQITGTLDTELEEIGARQIAAQQRDIDAFEREKAQYNTIQDDLRAVSGEYINLRNTWTKINQLREQDIPNDMALVYNILKMYDPQSTVMPGEQASVTNAASAPQAVRAIYNKLITGKGTLDPQVRAGFIRQADDIYQAAFETQKSIEADFIEKGRATGLRESLQEAIGFTTLADAQAFGERDLSRRVAPQPETAATAASEAGPQLVDESGASRLGADLITEGVEWVEGIGRIARGAQLIKDGGKYYEVERDGTRREVPPPNDMIPAGGNLPEFISDVVDRNFESPLELRRANREAREEAEREAHNARIRRQRQAAGADPETGIFPIKRPTNGD